MRALGVTTRERSAAAPDLPTFAESGLPDFDVSAWTGLFVPSGTPQAIVERLNAATQRLFGDSAYHAQIAQMGTDVASSTPEVLGAFMRQDIRNWTEAVKASGAHVE
jgi:tripartite-type tricarboxylate transporter receptor subunit TctC